VRWLTPGRADLPELWRSVDQGGVGSENDAHRVGHHTRLLGPLTLVLSMLNR
jgi:hypothetical protein